MDASIVFGMAAALSLALALAWKWQLGIVRVAATLVVLDLLAAALVVWASRFIGLNSFEKGAAVTVFALGAALGLLAWRFFRDPERTPPRRSDVLVSPADGIVVYVRSSEKGSLPVATKHGNNYTISELTKTPLCGQEAVVIGIGMSFLDVHVNRAPCPGRVVLCKHFPGLFGSLRLPEMVFENERATTVIDNNGYLVAVVQIASRLVRLIALYVKEGQELTLGQRLGVIRLGSQVDVVLPVRKGLDIRVKPGDRVRAGESIIAELKHTQ